jgi:hypothetical protein
MRTYLSLSAMNQKMSKIAHPRISRSEDFFEVLDLLEVMSRQRL